MIHQSNSKILVVDDNLGARKSIEALLAPESYNFLLAASGQEALTLLEEQTPDVILLDVMMPGMNGFEVCREIRSNPRISEIPILLITALDDEESMLNGIDAGADDFLSKPISKIELRSRIRSILRLNRFRKLCDERHKFELVVAQSQLGYLVLDQEFTIRFANATAQKMLSYQVVPGLPTHFFDYVRSGYNLQPEDFEQSLIESESRDQAEPFLIVQPATAQKRSRWIKGTFLELGLDNGNQHLLKLEDITEQILSFQEKQTFSRMISHKLLTPLNAIKAANQMLTGKNDCPENIKQIATIQQQGISRLEYDVHSVLSFLDSERSNKTTTGLKSCESIIRQVADAAAFNFSLTCEGDFLGKGRINISPTSFEACIREIVQNAIKFHQGDDVVLQALMFKSGDQVAFAFKNNSNSLTQEELKNAWKPYWQADRYSTGEIPGMGLGLSLVATHVWTAGGTCRLENAPDGKGVEIVLTFPLPQHAPEPQLQSKT